MHKLHELKTLGVYFDAVERGEKLFEVRKNDRFFQAGDLVALLRTHHAADLSGREYTGLDGGWERCPSRAKRLVFRIGPILQGGQFGIEPGYCVFSLLPVEGGGDA